MHLHRFLWRDIQEEEISEYAITRVNIGDRPAGCIAQLAMRETAKLTKFAHLEEDCRVLEENSYVDDILTSHNNQERLNEIINRLEEILTAGGFALKPWVRSWQSERSEVGGPTQGPEESISQAKTRTPKPAKRQRQQVFRHRIIGRRVQAVHYGFHQLLSKEK